VADGDSPFSGNLFVGLAGAESGAEHFEELLSRAGFRVERIVSTGQASPPDFWYDQEVAEWVVLLSGAAELQFEDEAAPRTLAPGDWINIAARRRHRVNWTDPSQPSIWLAIHYRQ
jgi:cupin 2 domain-containing protein